TVTVTVGTPPSTLTTPTAVDDTASAVSTVISPATAPATVSIVVLGNDNFGVAGPNATHPLTFKNGSTSSASAAGGTIVVGDNGTSGNLADDVILYTPLAGFTGTDTFTYKITNSTGFADEAEVTITVTDGTVVANDPTAVDDTASVALDATVSIAVLDNDTAGTEGYATPAIVSTTNPTSGVIAIVSDEITFDATGVAEGVYTFTYTIADASNDQDTATVTVT
uniref:Ig-like domain-containing protein n=1 Tax=uncultured Polaribacter sp. TaxID=174711 RepID=UPI002621DD4F